MAGFPLTAWALRHPWGDHGDAVFDRSREPSEAPSSRDSRADALDALLEQPIEAIEQACARWGSSSVAAVVGVGGASAPAERLASIRNTVVERTAVRGATYGRIGIDDAGATAMVSAHRLVRASLADAVVVVMVDDAAAALVLLERHGDAFVELAGSAEATGTTDGTTLDASVTREILGSVWDAVERAPLGYLHAAVSDADPRAPAERQVARQLLGSTPCRCPPVGSRTADVVLAITSLVRGFAPGSPSHELPHDRVLLHACSPAGRHAALLLEARP